VPEAFSPDPARARAAVARALAAGRSWLGPDELGELLAAYGIPHVQTVFAASPAEAAACARRLGGSVALKLVSPDVTHKTDVGGVALDLAPEAVESAAIAMRERVGKKRPEARVDGFAIQPMARRPGAFELIAGASTDPVFGPVVLFGHGGTAVERTADQAIALPPLNLHLAREAISRTRVSRILAGGRGQPAADVDAVALALVQVAQLVADVPELVELDLNPLLADASGVLALDARARIESAQADDRLAIRPYPKELEEIVELGGGRTLLLRPIRPEDEPSLQATFAKLTPEEIRLRFLVPLKTLSHVMAARFTQLDYDREMALVLTDPGPAGRTEIYGVVRLHADPDNDRAEYAILVRHDMTGMGLGVLLMRRILDHAASRGIREVYGDVLEDNATMRKMCRVLGFEESLTEEPGIVRVVLRVR
jgi:acetyltransferase